MDEKKSIILPTCFTSQESIIIAQASLFLHFIDAVGAQMRYYKMQHIRYKDWLTHRVHTFTPTWFTYRQVQIEKKGREDSREEIFFVE